MTEETNFERASKAGRTSIVGEFAAFLLENKKWWMLPIVLALGVVGALVFFAGTGAAPFIYTLF